MYQEVYIGDAWTTVSGMVKITVCRGCGSVVFDTDLHDNMHARYDHAASNASMLDKIG